MGASLNPLRIEPRVQGLVWDSLRYVREVGSSSFGLRMSEGCAHHAHVALRLALPAPS